MKVEFNALPAAVRTRFVEATRASKDPQLVYAERNPTGVLVALQLLIMFVVWSSCNAGALATPGVAGPVLLTFLGSAAAGFLAINLAVRFFRPKLPYPEGTFVFAGHAVRTDPHDGKLHVLPLASAQLTQVHLHRKSPGSTGEGTYTSTHIEGEAGGERESLTWGLSKERAQTVLDSIDTARTRWREAVARGDREAARQLDPFAPCVEAGAWDRGGEEPGPRVQLASPAVWAAQGCGALLLAACAAVVMGGALTWRAHVKAKERAAANAPALARSAAAREKAEKAREAAESLAAKDDAVPAITGIILGGDHLWVQWGTPEWAADSPVKDKGGESAIQFERTDEPAMKLLGAELPARVEKWGRPGLKLAHAGGYTIANLVVHRTLRLESKEAKYPTVTFKASFHPEGANGPKVFEFEHTAPPGEGKTRLEVRKAQHEAFAKALIARLFR